MCEGGELHQCAFIAAAASKDTVTRAELRFFAAPP
jgi:hypothetical protein